MHDKTSKGLFVTLATSATVGAATFIGTSWYAMKRIRKAVEVNPISNIIELLMIY